MNVDVTVARQEGGTTIRFAHPEGAFRVEVFYTPAVYQDNDVKASYSSLVDTLGLQIISVARDLMAGKFAVVDQSALADESEPLDPNEEAAVRAAREKLS